MGCFQGSLLTPSDSDEVRKEMSVIVIIVLFAVCFFLYGINALGEWLERDTTWWSALVFTLFVSLTLIAGGIIVS